uniref:NADH-ubiquinone oxidoreductase chain 5 n=1 Tax=Achatinella sowerbyana TaxID=115944 RepID=A0A343A148_9EUPU|nr:NADH dehydrogenase subunit 5 [Achatinella sowerbyana]
MLLLRNKSLFRFSLLLGSMLIFLLFTMLNSSVSNLIYLLEVKLLYISSMWFSMSFIIDYLSLSFSLVVLVVSLCVFSFAINYMYLDLSKFRFMIVLVMFVFSMNLLVMSGSFLTLMIGWDGLGLSSFVLIIYYMNSNSFKAGMLTLLSNRIGDIMIMWSFTFFCYLGYFNIFPLEKCHFTCLLLLTIAAMTKSAQYPFSAWLPAAMAAPTPVSALVHSSTLVTAGVFLLIRFLTNMQLSLFTINMLNFVSAMTCFLGGVAACFEHDIKKVIAFSTLSQLGLMMYSISMNFPNLALIHLYTHAMFKSLLFLSAGMILMVSFGIQDLRLLGSIIKYNPSLCLFFNISTLCLLGIPFMSSFYSKHIIYEMMMMSSLNIFSLMLMLLGTMLTGIYSIRMLLSLVWEKNCDCKMILKISMSEYFPMILLFIMSIIIGKMLKMNNMIFWETLYVSSMWSLVTMILPIIGAFLGMYMMYNTTNYFFSTMFFLWESSNSVNLLLMQPSKKMKVLDYGWLEPFHIKSSFYNILDYKLSMFFRYSLIYYMNFMFHGSMMIFMVFMVCYMLF